MNKLNSIMHQRPSGRIYEKLNKRKHIMDRFAIAIFGWIVFAASFFLIKTALYWITG